MTAAFFLRPETNDQFLEKLGDVLHTKKPVIYEYLNYNKSGKSYWVSGTLTPVLDIHEGIKEIIVIETDITNYKVK
ncbi:MAG TPA: PAS domain-containing protein [Bacteroidia bacterium]|nr:PAS domain-containing protein [Bacteroidia bacterium]